MKTNQTKWLAVLSMAALAACGDNSSGDAAVGNDGSTPGADVGTASDSGSTPIDAAAMADVGSAVDGGGGSVDSGMGGSDAGAQPRGAANRPTPGAQVDRMGRPAISTALIAAFQPDATMRGAAKDGYNANAVSTSWPTMYANEIAANLPIYDILDQTCGNQTAYAATAAAGMRFMPLATLLADDMLVLNASGTCDDGGYLAVEAGVAGNCGGRTPNADVIDRSFSVLAAGVLSGVSDGVAQSGPMPDVATFPFLAAPAN